MSESLQHLPTQDIQDMHERAELEAQMTADYIELLQRELARRAGKAIETL